MLDRHRSSMQRPLPLIPRLWFGPSKLVNPVLQSVRRRHGRRPGLRRRREGPARQPDGEPCREADGQTCDHDVHDHRSASMAFVPLDGCAVSGSRVMSPTTRLGSPNGDLINPCCCVGRFPEVGAEPAREIVTFDSNCCHRGARTGCHLHRASTRSESVWPPARTVGWRSACRGRCSALPF